MSPLIGAKQGLSKIQLSSLVMGAMLHDVGKSRVPKEVDRLKHSNLTDAELLKLHTSLGYKLIKDEIGLPEEIAVIAMQHHERCDGTGYPKNLTAEVISNLSQIVGICNIYDAIISAMPYDDPMASQKAVKIIATNAGRWYDSLLLNHFIEFASF